MDPNATLAALLDIATRRNASHESAQATADTLRDIAEHLATWIENGGFAPSDPRGAK